MPSCCGRIDRPFRRIDRIKGGAAHVCLDAHEPVRIYSNGVPEPRMIHAFPQLRVSHAVVRISLAGGAGAIPLTRLIYG